MDRGVWWATVHGVTKSWHNQSELACTRASLWASLITHLLKNPPEMRETWIQFLGWDDPLEKGPLRVPWTLRRSNQSILKEISPEYSLERCWSWNSNTLATWCEELTHWKRPWCWERLKQEEKGTTEDGMVGWHHWLDDMSLSKFWELVMDREALRAAVHGVSKNWTWLSDWTELMLSYAHTPSSYFQLHCRTWGLERIWGIIKSIGWIASRPSLTWSICPILEWYYR